MIRRNPEDTKTYLKEWRRLNPDYMKKYRKKYAKRIKQQQYEYKATHKEKLSNDFRKYNLKKVYGLTLEDYVQLEKKHKYRCAICKTKNIGNQRVDVWYIDHCHVTKKIRGLLCHRCNSLLGHAQDNVTILKSSIKYLEKHK